MHFLGLPVMGGSAAPWGLHYWTELTITLNLYL